MTQILNDDHGRGPVLCVGSGSHLNAFMALGIMEAMKSPGGEDMVYRIEDELHYPDRRARVAIDEQGPWPPAPVDPIVAKHARLRIEKAAAKRSRKNLKRLGFSQFPMTGPGCQQAKKFLIDIDQYEAFQNNGQSVDGFTLVAWANAELEKLCLT